MPRRPSYQAPPKDERILLDEELAPFSAAVLAHRASILAKRSTEHSGTLHQLEATHAAPEHALEQWDDEGGRHNPGKLVHARVLRF